MRRKVIVILLAIMATFTSSYADTSEYDFGDNATWDFTHYTGVEFKSVRDREVSDKEEEYTIDLNDSYSYTSQPQEEEVSGHWESLGDCRVTTYCTACNSPAGHASATGKYLEYGDVACSWLPMGTHILIDGEEFTVVDVCGTEAIDIFLDGPIDECICDRNYYTEVYIWKE